VLTILDVTFHDLIHGEQHVIVSSPAGGGGSFGVYINKYFRGQIVHYSTGWQSFVKSDVLMGDDIGVILDFINEDYPCV